VSSPRLTAWLQTTRHLKKPRTTRGLRRFAGFSATEGVGARTQDLRLKRPLLRNRKPGNDNDLRSGDPTPVSYLCQESGHTTPSGECNSPRQPAVNCSQALSSNEVKELPSPALSLEGDDPELAAVVAAWATLPEAARARIVGLVEGATAWGKA